MRIFVTGGTGFIGSSFLRCALDAGCEVYALRRPGSSPRVPLSRPPIWVDGTLAAFDATCLADCDTLVHFAASGVLPGTAQWDKCFNANVTQSLSLWLLACSQGVRHLIISGSCYEYGRSAERYERIPITAPLEPMGPYHSSKAAASMAAYGVATNKKVGVTILRPFNVYGEGESPERFFPALREAALSGRDFVMTPGEQVRDFIDVVDVARIYLQSVENPPGAGVVEVKNVGSGTSRTLRNFAEYWWKRWEAKGQLRMGGLPYNPDEVMRYVPEVATA
jgi:nucleoside-diphosphate-sugar epimerase